MLKFPNAAKSSPDKHRKILEHSARSCPVHYSLHPDIVKHITFSNGNFKDQSWFLRIGLMLNLGVLSRGGDIEWQPVKKWPWAILRPKAIQYFQLPLAITASGIYLQFSAQEPRIKWTRFHGSCHFFPNKSWYKHKTYQFTCFKSWKTICIFDITESFYAVKWGKNGKDQIQ